MSRPRILVVDDEDLVRLVIARTLRQSGFEVFEARDGLEALARLPAIAPDLVLTDYYMPRCNGERLCRELHAQPVTAQLPIVVMTGGPVDEAGLRALGCAAVVYKPLPDGLGELLRGVLHTDGGTPSARHSAA